MGEELNEQVDAGTEAPAEGASQEAASSEATTEAPQTEAPDISAQIETAVQAAIDKYEGKGGHLAKLRSQKDKEIAALQRQLREQQTGRMEEAQALLESDPAQAAQILAGIVEAQAQQSLQASKHQELVDWQYRILEDLGADPEGDEDAATLAAEWSERLVEDPNLTWDFQQAAARFQLERKEQTINKTTKELTELKESLPETIKAEVTRALAGAGIIPDPSEGGEPAPPKDSEWRKKPTGQLITDGLAARMARPIQRT